MQAQKINWAIDCAITNLINILNQRELPNSDLGLSSITCTFLGVLPQNQTIARYRVVFNYNLLPHNPNAMEDIAAIITMPVNATTAQEAHFSGYALIHL